MLRPAVVLFALTCGVALAADADTRIELHGDEILYTGPLTHEANRKAFELYESAQSKPGVITVTSPGGAIDVGLELGEWILSKELHVKVTDFCFSSCANYVFPAGRTKILERSAMIGFHGGAFSKDYNRSQIEETLSAAPPDQRARLKEQITHELDKYVTENRRREAAFYARLGISADLNTLGQGPRYREFQGGDYDGWYYSLGDMKKLGLANVVIVGEEWQPAISSGKYRLFRVEVDK